MADPSVRPYHPADRDAVRRIAHQTGYMGEPADWFWRDLPSFADIWTGYYTDREPGSAFVAERDGRVVGYLLGCERTGPASSPAAALAHHTLRRLLFFRPGTAGFLWRSLFDTVRARHLPTGELLDARWPSHLHTNLLPAGRGRGLGAALMRAWLEHLRGVGSPGCHLATLAENEPAIAFFQRMGFARFGAPQLVPGMRLRSGGRMHLQFMTQALSGHGSGSRAPVAL